MLYETTGSLVDIAHRVLPVTRQSGHARRDGISLLEVLISIFVLAIGLLGVAAVIPLGRLQAQRAIQSQRTATLGQSKLREMQINGVLDPCGWVGLSTATRWEHVVVFRGGRPALQLNSSWFLDPLFVAENPGIQTGAVPATSSAPSPCPIRVSLVPSHLAGFSPASPIELPLAQRMFTGTDDQVIPIPEDGDERPRQMVLSEYSSGQWIGAAWPARAGDQLSANGSSVSATAVNEHPLSREYHGKFSCLITVVPEPTTPDFFQGTQPNLIPYAYLDKIRLVVSVVVFNDRDTTLPEGGSPRDKNIPSERNVGVNFQEGGGGWGGGEVILESASAGMLDLEEGGWLMIHSRNTSNFSHPAQWYSVVALDDVLPVSNGFQRRASLSGPDWRFNLIANNNSVYPERASAILMTNVVGVYTTTIQPDYHSAAWGLHTGFPFDETQN